MTELSGHSHLCSAASGLYDVRCTPTYVDMCDMCVICAMHTKNLNSLPAEPCATLRFAGSRNNLKTFLFNPFATRVSLKTVEKLMYIRMSGSKRVNQVYSPDDTCIKSI